MAVYFTADPHIGHDKDFLWRPRGFSSIEEHDTEILKRWNSIVTPEDTVYILGDLCMSGNEKEWNRVYKVLNGEKIVIWGNHDTNNKLNKYQTEYGMTYLGFASIYKYSKKKMFYLSHYPTLVGNFEEQRFFWNLSGHTHSSNKFEFGQYSIYNVAMDAHNCYPVSIEQIIKDIDKYKEKKE